MIKNIAKEFVKVGYKRNKPYNLCYSLIGNGDEKVLLIMGLLVRGKHWTSTLNELSKLPNYSNYTFCIYDHNGVGDSEYTTFSSISDLSLDTIELLDHLGWKQTNVIGLSFGSKLAYELSLNSPHLIKTLNLTSFNAWNNHNSFRSKAINFYSILHGCEPSKIYLNLIFSQSFLQAPSDKTNDQLQLDEKKYKNIDFLVPVANKLFEDRNSVPVLIKLNYFFSIFTYRLYPFKNTCSIKKENIMSRPFPILIIAGENDNYTNFKTFSKMCGIIQPNQVNFCIGSGHALNFENTKQFSKDSIEFFNYKPKSKNDLLNFKQVVYTNYKNTTTDTNDIIDFNLPFYKLNLFKNIKQSFNLNLINFLKFVK